MKAEAGGWSQVLLWMFIHMPLALVSLPLRLVGVDVMGGPQWLFIRVYLIDFYLLSCLVNVGLDWVKAKWKS